MVTYESIEQLAVRSPLNARASTAVGLLPGFDSSPIGTIQQYLASHRRDGSHAALLGTEQMLGQTVDIVKLWPTVVGESGDCGEAHPKNPCRKISYGSLRVWVDEAHHFILRWINDVPARFGGRTEYRVTSITFGQAPAPAQLAFHPPVPVTSNPPSTAENRGGAVLINGPWTPPSPFLPAQPPTFGRTLGVSQGSSETDFPITETPSDESVLFALPTRPSHTLLVPPARITGSYLYIHEALRKNGLPPLFTRGTARVFDACTIFAGRYTDGIHWVGTQHGDVAIMVTSNNFGGSRLTAYTSRQFCT
jgi:hypothetical protein